MADRDYSKSPNMLGLLMHGELFERSGAVMPNLQGLLANAGEALTDNIAEQWGIIKPNAPRLLTSFFNTSAESIPHMDAWKFPLRTAQCAALAKLRMQAQLVPLETPDETPRIIAVRTIHDLGQRAVGLLSEEIDPDFLNNPEFKADMWPSSIKEKIASLCIKPVVFVKIMSEFANRVTPESLPTLLQAGTHASMGALYKICTAAALVGQELQIDFVPFDQPLSEAATV